MQDFDRLDANTTSWTGCVGLEWTKHVGAWACKSSTARRVGSVTNTMGNFKLLNLFKPAQRIIPDVPAPQERRVPFKYVVKKHEDDVHHQIKDTSASRSILLSFDYTGIYI